MDKTDYQIKLLDQNTNNFFKLKNPNQKALRYALIKNPWFIKHIKNPSKELQQTAVDINVYTIKHIKDLHIDIQWDLARHEPITVLKYGKNFNENVIWHIIRSSPTMIRYIKYPKHELIAEAIEGNPNAILNLQEVPEWIQLKAVDFDEEKYICDRNQIADKVLNNFSPHSEDFIHEFKKLKIKHGITG